MKTLIQNKLTTVEKEFLIKVLFACESGSRAWGFESKDSDYDIRFIFKRRVKDYLKLKPEKDTIEFFGEEGLFDYNGWDIRKALNLFSKSNPPFIEWVRSPIVYKEEFDFRNKIEGLILQIFNPKSAIYHYLNIARSNFKEYFKSDLIKQKKYFYVLRAILAASFVAKNKVAPPMEFSNLLTQLKNEKLKQIVDDLLEKKKAGDELDGQPSIKELDDFIVEKIEYLEKVTKEMNEKK